MIVQGVEAGGHVRGKTAALELLERTRAALPAGYPVWLAGGIADAADVREALDAGADAAVLGTRFLLTEESGAHPEYKRRALGGGPTLLTRLFGAGWPAAHRVLPNAATERWLGGDPVEPAWLRGAAPGHRAAAGPRPRRRGGAGRGAPAPRLTAAGPPAAGRGRPAGLVEAGPLYAGETVARIGELRPAGELTRELAAA